MTAEDGAPEFVRIMAHLPWVCPSCSRRFPREPLKGRCPDHKVPVKVTDQHELVQAYMDRFGVSYVFGERNY